MQGVEAEKGRCERESCKNAQVKRQTVQLQARESKINKC